MFANKSVLKHHHIEVEYTNCITPGLPALTAMEAKSTVFAFIGVAIFFATIFITPLTAFADKKGQDYPNEKCQRNNTDGSTTTGQCSNVCKDLTVSTTKDVDSGLRTCDQAARSAGGWGIVAVVGNPSMLFVRYNEDGEVQACAPTSKPDEIECRHVTIREAKRKSGK
jgi:hypothetical protein